MSGMCFNEKSDCLEKKKTIGKKKFSYILQKFEPE